MSVAASRRKQVDHSVPELPSRPQVGDRIKLKPSKALAYRTACEAAGWELNTDAIRVVVRADPYLPGGGRRLFVDGPPTCLSERDVDLAWNNDDERRQALRALGWRV